MAGVTVVVSGGGTIVASADGGDSTLIEVGDQASPVGVSVPGGTVVSASVSGAEPASVSVAGAGVPVSVAVSGGIGPAAAVDTNSGAIIGVNPTSVFGGTNITVSASSAAYTIFGVSDAYMASKSPVQQVAGRTGSVVLIPSDISGLTTAIQQFANVLRVQGRTGEIVITRDDLTAAAVVHTHSATEIFGLPVLSVQGRTGNVILTRGDITAAAVSHTHAASQIYGLPVLSVQGRTGNVVITKADITAAAASHTHSADQIFGLSAAQIPDLPVVSVQGRTGDVVLSVEDLSAATSTHTHSISEIAGSVVYSLSTITGDVTIVGSGGITVSTSASSITIASPTVGGIQWSGVPESPQTLIGTAGDVARDESNIYVCNGPGNWKRAGLTTWSTTDPLFSYVRLLLHFDEESIPDSSPLNRTATNYGVYTDGSTSRFGPSSGYFFNNFGTTTAYLEYAYDSWWDLQDNYTIEFWIAGSGGSYAPFNRIIGTAGWGVYVTMQSEQDYGTSKRIELVRFDGSGAVVARADCGPIVEGQWNYYGISPVRSCHGTQPGQTPTFINHPYSWSGGLFLGTAPMAMVARSSPLIIGGNLFVNIDEIRITNGWSRSLAKVPSSPFPNA